MILGWIGVGLLVASYCILLIPNKLKIFFLVDSIASVILTIHAIAIKDYPFIFVNGFITIVLIYKYFKTEEGQ